MQQRLFTEQPFFIFASACHSGNLEECKKIHAKYPACMESGHLVTAITNYHFEIMKWMIKENLQLLFHARPSSKFIILSDSHCFIQGFTYHNSRTILPDCFNQTFSLIKKIINDDLSSSNLSADSKIILLCEMTGREISPEFNHSEAFNNNLETISQLTSSNNNIDNPDMVAESLNLLGKKLFDMKAYNQAKQCCELALTLARMDTLRTIISFNLLRISEENPENTNKKDIASQLKDFGNQFIAASLWHAAVYCFEQALPHTDVKISLS